MGLFGGSSCYDQSAIWVPQISRLVWVMLSGSILRLCIASPERLKSTMAGPPRRIEIAPDLLGLAEESFDFPQLALGSGMLYVSMMRCPKGSEHPNGAALLRFRLDDLIEEKDVPTNFQYFATKEVTNFGLAQDAHGTGFWAAHLRDTTTGIQSLRLYSWDESSNSIHQSDVPIDGYVLDNYQSLTPDRFDWLDHHEDRITGGARLSAGTDADHLVFAWTAGRSLPERPHPYIRLEMLRYDRQTRNVSRLGSRDIFHHEHAWAFPALAGIDKAVLAMTCAWGGGLSDRDRGSGRFFPTHQVGFVDVPVHRDSRYHNMGVASSTVGAPRWGDFLCLRHDDPISGVFVTAGFTVHLHRPTDPVDPTEPRAAIHVVRFMPR